METGEISTPRMFDDLNGAEKINAILGTIREPMSKDLALSYSGVDYQGLDDDEKKAIDSVFSSEDVITITVDNTERYQLSDDAKKRLATSVNMDSVHERIIKSIAPRLGFDF